MSFAPYEPEPVRPWHDEQTRANFAAAIDRAKAASTITVPIIVDGQIAGSASSIESHDPANPTRLIATASAAGADHADRAVASADKAFPQWSIQPAAVRAGVLVAAAAWMRDRRDDLSALEVFEAGKPWDEADADVCEAIDFLEYYARQALVLEEGGEVQSPLGESNRMRYVARGVTAAITPWNFPLAIPTGMVSSAIAAGNTVCFKPAEQTPGIAYQLVEAFRAGGLPDGVLQFLPGYGEEVGAALVAHRDVATISFTGSRDVGLLINHQASTPIPNQRYIKRVLAELGGKNALILDTDADLDEAVPAIAKGAFGFCGQKCSATSRLIIIARPTADGNDRVEEFKKRLVAHAHTQTIGHPEASAVSVGPVTDQEAYERLQTVLAESDDDVWFQAEDLPAEGWFVPPTVVRVRSSKSPLWTDEQFGPILAVDVAPDLDTALAMANDSPYGLTAGLFTRSPRSIARAQEFRAGNVYVNRSTTGAVVGRQPFGGVGMSGMGAKAGGPDTLRMLCDAQVVTENTMRQGFAADLVT